MRWGGPCGSGSAVDTSWPGGLRSLAFARGDFKDVGAGKGQPSEEKEEAGPWAISWVKKPGAMFLFHPFARLGLASRKPRPARGEGPGGKSTASRVLRFSCLHQLVTCNARLVSSLHYVLVGNSRWWPGHRNAHERTRRQAIGASPASSLAAVQRAHIPAAFPQL